MLKALEWNELWRDRVAGRIFFEIAIFLFPFALFGVYLLVTADAERDGRRKWPINALFLSGVALALIGMMVLIFLERANPDSQCRTATKIVDGQIVQGERYDCSGDFSELGSPRTGDPGGVARGTDDDREDAATEAPVPSDMQDGDPQ